MLYLPSLWPCAPSARCYSGRWAGGHTHTPRWPSGTWRASQASQPAVSMPLSLGLPVEMDGWAPMV
jgi:hypothetical protein